MELLQALFTGKAMIVAINSKSPTSLLVCNYET